MRPSFPTPATVVTNSFIRWWAEGWGWVYSYFRRKYTYIKNVPSLILTWAPWRPRGYSCRSTPRRARPTGRRETVNSPTGDSKSRVADGLTPPVSSAAPCPRWGRKPASKTTTGKRNKIKVNIETAGNFYRSVTFGLDYFVLAVWRAPTAWHIPSYGGQGPVKPSQYRSRKGRCLVFWHNVRSSTSSNIVETHGVERKVFLPSIAVQRQRSSLAYLVRIKAMVMVSQHRALPSKKCIIFLHTLLCTVRLVRYNMATLIETDRNGLNRTETNHPTEPNGILCNKKWDFFKTLISLRCVAAQHISQDIQHNGAK